MFLNVISQIEVHRINYVDIINEIVIFVTLEMQAPTKGMSFPNVRITHSVSGKATGADL
jgi:hypothetical protein